jgi:peptidoglycan/LPS O-acetylase OafA/YrhL
MFLIGCSAGESAMTGNPKKLLISPLQSDLLDLSRWIAAFLVVAEHARSFIFCSYASGPQVGLAGKAFYFLTGFGHSAVMIFFVMSGFLVGGKVLEKLAQGAFSWQKYAIDRSSRLYAVYLLALILGAVLDYCGYHYLNRFGLYDRSFSGNIAVVGQDFHAAATPAIFGVNLLMCQTVLGPVFGSNGPLWSLANEFWYYLAAPLLFALVFLPNRRVAFLRVVALAGIVWLLPANILIYFLVWLLGAALYFLNQRPLLPVWLTLPVFLGCFSLTRMQLVQIPYLGDFLIGVSFALVINSTVLNSQRLLAHTLSRKAADFSYSVYLCHFPFLVFVLSALHQATGRALQETLSLTPFGLYLLVLALTYGWCYLISLATERQTSRIRQWLYRVLNRDQLAKAGTVR